MKTLFKQNIHNQITMLDRFFKLTDNKTTIRTEVIAGVTTFMTMAYILFLNPNILSVTGMDKNAVFFATAVGAGIVTIAMLDGGLKKKARQNKALVDQISATILLQSYLESRQF